MSESVRGRVYLLAAALFWSLSGVLVKSPSLGNVPALVLACERAWWAAICLTPVVNWKTVRWRRGLLPMVICFASMNFLFISSLTRTTAAASIFLQYTAAGWAFLFGVMILKERADRGNLVALLFGLAGIVWIVHSDWDGERFEGNALALASGLSYAGVIVSLRFLRDESAAWLVWLNHVVSGAVLLPFAATALPQLNLSQHTLLAALGGIQMALPYVLFARGLRSVTAQEASLITLLEPLLNPLWVWLFWGELVPGATWIGGALILCGLALKPVIDREVPALRRHNPE